MTSGPRQIRVACAKCGYNKLRTLEAGDDRTLEQLSASLRCGGCRTWGKSGAVSVSSVGLPRRKPGAAKITAKAAGRPLVVHGTCLNCGHNENFKPKWQGGETLTSLAQDITCPACGAEGSASNIYLRAAMRRGTENNGESVPWHLAGSILATLAWPFELLGLMIVIPLKVLVVAIGRLLAPIREPLLIGSAMLGGVAAFVGVAYIAAVLIGAALSGPANLAMRAVEHEYQDNVRNSPRGGYYERLDRKQAETPRQMTYYNRRTIGDE